MRFKLLLLNIFSFVFLFSCAVKKERVMPYYNYGYTAQRLFPVSLSNADFEFRIWINNGTSVDRIISVSKSKDFGDEAYLMEIGTLSAKKRTKNLYTKTKAIPKSGINKFITELDSLNLSDVKSEPDSNVAIAFDRPFSLYTVELKENGKYNCFRFITAYPYKEGDTTSKYHLIQNLILKEFHYSFYMK